MVPFLYPAISRYIPDLSRPVRCSYLTPIHVGKTNTEHNVNEARKRSGAYMARVLRPGQVTTREFNAERLNLEVDATGRIIAARCG